MAGFKDNEVGGEEVRFEGSVQWMEHEDRAVLDKFGVHVGAVRGVEEGVRESKEVICRS